MIATVNENGQMQVSETAVCRRPRTALQAAASRRNGAKSCGPRTTKGKTVSRLNASTHGLFSKVLPFHNTRYVDRDSFDRLLEKLKLQYNPRTILEVHLIELLAANMYRLYAIMRHLDVMFDNPQEGSVHKLFDHHVRADCSEWDMALPLLEQTLTATKTGNVASLAADELEFLTNTIWKYATHWAEEVKMTKEDIEETERENKADQEYNLVELREKLSLLEKSSAENSLECLNIRCQDDLRSALSGQQSIDMPIWTNRLTKIIDHAKDKIYRCKVKNDAVETEVRRDLRYAIPTDTAKLETLVRYEAHIRRAVDRDLAMLERARAMA